jgi:hypothetical protein
MNLEILVLSNWRREQHLVLALQSVLGSLLRLLIKLRC